MRTPSAPSPLGVVTACAAFVLIGALQALYGPAVSAFRADFGIGLGTAGLALGAHFVGGVAGVLVHAGLSRRFPARALLATALVIMAIGGAGVALAPRWPLALLAALVAGIGFGGIDYGLNDLFARAYTRRGPAMLNILNAHFGIGAVAGPFLVAALGPQRYPAIFLGFAVASLLLVPGLRGIRPGDGRTPTGTTAPGAMARSFALLAAFITVYVLNVGIEAGVGGWEPTHLETIGHSAASAASATSVYWLMLTVGRFLVVPLTLRWSDQTIVVGSCVGAAVCLALSAVPSIAAVAYAGVGLFIAPVFPTALPWLRRAVPGAQGAGAYVIAASMIGGVVVPPLVGGGIAWTGVAALPVLLSALNGLCLVTLWWIIRAQRTERHRRSGHDPIDSSSDAGDPMVKRHG
ncbi:MFS transporter [Actinomadura kijaniata]|uniref:MFS transporter n=1 Tax=Actinomadura kijaniata TaxID=46161 RepID=UPI000ACCBAD5|nr:MFS transporter [Actinomadura kijaniata]